MVQPSLTICPCGTGLHFDQCCYKFIARHENPNNPEALMRSRFSAYVIADYEYILATYAAEQQNKLSVTLLKKDAMGTNWRRLAVHNSSQSGDVGYVEFSAFYEVESQFYVMHESSDFVKINQRWYYTSGVIHKDSGLYVQQRNDLCLCNSGKKYKKCCA